MPTMQAAYEESFYPNSFPATAFVETPISKASLTDDVS
jgi:hypothetical protein